MNYKDEKYEMNALKALHDYLDKAYNDGQKDGIVSVLKGEGIGKDAVIIYMMANHDIPIEKIAEVFEISEEDAQSTYDDARFYFTERLQDKQQKAYHKLFKMVKSELDSEVLF